MSSPFIRLKNHRKVATGKKSEILMHACYAEPPFSKGVLTIHYLLECPTWGLSVGIGLAAIGPFPDTNFIQMFSDTTMGLFGDRLEFMVNFYFFLFLYLELSIFCSQERNHHL